jgi:hypothetical protein
MAYFLSMALPTYTQIMTGHMHIKVLKSATNWNVIDAFGILPCQLKTDYSLALIICMMGTALFITRKTCGVAMLDLLFVCSLLENFPRCHA